MSNESQPLFTIGHSNIPLEALGDLLLAQDIQVVVDVRSSPYTKYAVHFNKESLERYLTGLGLRYVYMGKELGGMPDSPGFYDEEGHVRYDVIAASPAFLEGLDKLVRGARLKRVAVMCSEEDPSHCHRRLLLARVLRERGLQVRHLRADGRVQTEEELAREEELAQTHGQQSLFEQEEPQPWRSIQSVTRKSPRNGSSNS
jgi:uncharacterized protein (DUF488 family)